MRTPHLKKLLDELDATLAAAAFAEENEPATARRLLWGGARAAGAEAGRRRSTGARRR